MLLLWLALTLTHTSILQNQTCLFVPLIVKAIVLRTEAAILGIPIITTSVSGGEEIINDCECGILTGMDNESLKKCYS